LAPSWNTGSRVDSDRRVIEKEVNKAGVRVGDEILRARSFGIGPTTRLGDSLGSLSLLELDCTRYSMGVGSLGVGTGIADGE